MAASSGLSSRVDERIVRSDRAIIPPAPHRTLILVKVLYFIEAMATADDIINELRKRPGLTAMEIASAQASMPFYPADDP